jgi:hypothetical protein
MPAMHDTSVLPSGSAPTTSLGASSPVSVPDVPTDVIAPYDASGVTAASTAPDYVAAPPRTRLQVGIRKPKHYTDGTIRYVYSLNSGEPYNLQEALSNPQWKATMDDEYGALMRNKTWALVPP